MIQHMVRRLTRGAPIFRVTSEDLDDQEARLFDEVMSEVGLPTEADFLDTPEEPDVPEPKRRTVANTYSTSRYYDMEFAMGGRS